jgi:methanethiol oxidase
MPAHPDPTFHASAKLAMQAPPEKLAYTVMLSPDFSQPDALAVVDLDPGSKSLGKIVHTVTMPNKGDEFHHFGWNVCSTRSGWRTPLDSRLRLSPKCPQTI